MNENHPTFEKCTVCGATNFAKYVVIPQEEWETIKRDLNSLVMGVQKPPEKRKQRIGSIECHPQLAEFLLENENSKTLIQIRDLARKKFGLKVAPSRSAISRFFQRQRAKRK